MAAQKSCKSKASATKDNGIKKQSAYWDRYEGQCGLDTAAQKMSARLTLNFAELIDNVKSGRGKDETILDMCRSEYAKLKVRSRSLRAEKEKRQDGSLIGQVTAILHDLVSSVETPGFAAAQVFLKDLRAKNHALAGFLKVSEETVGLKTRRLEELEARIDSLIKPFESSKQMVRLKTKRLEELESENSQLKQNLDAERIQWRDEIEKEKARSKAVMDIEITHQQETFDKNASGLRDEVGIRDISLGGDFRNRRCSLEGGAQEGACSTGDTARIGQGRSNGRAQVAKRLYEAVA